MLDGEKGPVRDAVLLNAAAALAAFDERAARLHDAVGAGMARAAAAVDDGAGRGAAGPLGAGQPGRAGPDRRQSAVSKPIAKAASRSCRE